MPQGAILSRWCVPAAGRARAAFTCKALGGVVLKTAAYQKGHARRRESHALSCKFRDRNSVRLRRPPRLAFRRPRNVVCSSAALHEADVAKQPLWSPFRGHFGQQMLRASFSAFHRSRTSADLLPPAKFIQISLAIGASHAGVRRGKVVPLRGSRGLSLGEDRRDRRDFIMRLGGNCKNKTRRHLRSKGKSRDR